MLASKLFKSVSFGPSKTFKSASFKSTSKNFEARFFSSKQTQQAPSKTQTQTPSSPLKKSTSTQTENFRSSEQLVNDANNQSVQEYLEAHNQNLLTQYDALKTDQERREFEMKASEEHPTNQLFQAVKERFDYNDPIVRYAFTWYSMFFEHSDIEELFDDISKFRDLMEKNASLKEFLQYQAREVNPAERSKAFEEDFLSHTEDYFSELTTSFLGVVSENQRLGDLTAIMDTVEEIHRKIVFDEHEATIITAKPLADAERTQILGMLKKSFKVQGDIVLTEQVDPKLKGGYEIFFDGEYHVDNSQRTTDSQLEAKIQQTVGEFFSNAENERMKDLQDATA